MADKQNSKLSSSRSNEDEELLKELCSVNGVKYSKLVQGGSDPVTSLEMFFSGYHRISGMNNFPNLSILILMGQDITKIEGLSTCTKLTELWICECKIKVIEGLDACNKMTILHLYSNYISQITHISHLQYLEVLGLANNTIVNIEGLSRLTRLRSLNLASNRIEKIGHCFDANTKLEVLNLSGNNICSFKELTHLVRLSSLKHLGLKDPMYGPNPVCYLCNYSTHVMYHLPHIDRLDSYDVSNQSLREMAETTVVKKKMYYNMRVKTIQRTLADMIHHINKEKRLLTRTTRDRLRLLCFSIKEIERYTSEVQSNKVTSIDSHLHHDNEEEQHGSGTESDTQDTTTNNVANTVSKLHTKLQALIERKQLCTQLIQQMDVYHGEAIANVKHTTEVTIKRLLAELESGGNVRFEEGQSSDLWFSSCHDLILSRFCAADYKVHDILGIKIHRITRVHNRMLRYRFDNKLVAVTEEEDTSSISRTPTLKRLQEYLFFVWDPDLPGGEYEPMKILEEGPMDSETYHQLGRDGAVPLSNSVSLCDKPRIQSAVSRSMKEASSDPCPFRHGQLVVCKVYLGKSLPALDVNMKVNKQFYPNADSVFRPKNFSVTDSDAQCECSARQCEWFIFDHEMVLPEYVIDFEYITKDKPPSPLIDLYEAKSAERKMPVAIHQDAHIDEDVLQMEPHIKPRPRLVSLSEDILLRLGAASCLTLITVLNLHGNGLTKLKSLAMLTSLQKLIVSFNELSKLEDLAHMASLEYIDASFNKLYTLDAFRGMSKLKTLDLSWNELSNTKDDLSILRKHAPGLVCLDLRYNSWQKPDGLRLRTIGRLKSLSMLDGQAVTESEATAALRMAAGSRISQVSLLAHTRTDVVRPRSLSLASCAQLLTLISRNKPDRLSENDSNWYSKVTTLYLDGQHLSKLSNLERLENLRWASFSDNDLTKIEGLDQCSQLEELSLQDNCIYKLEGIGKLSKLHTLNLSCNNISSIEASGLERLTQLQCLALSNNRISSLTGIAQVLSLLELYIGNNYIKNMREVFNLKNLPNFVILDLCGNPVASVDNYRLFVVYHLKTLKALDGIAVESSEGGTAKDKFGGRLTQDFVAEKLGHSNFHEVRELDFPQSILRQVDLGTGEHFINLRSVNLEHNNLQSFSGLVYLVNLRVLCLNHNHVECIVPRLKGTGPKSNHKGFKEDQADLYSPGNFTPILENLEVLHLGYNGISDLIKLQISRLPSLKALFLQGNEISKVEGLESLQDLRELVLDRNKIKGLSEYSFMNQWNLVELHMEENRLRELSHFQYLENLQRLYLGSNRLQDVCELEKLEALPNLIELSVISNPVSRRLMHRPMLVFRQPNLLCIDGIPVSPEERTKAEMYFLEQQPASTVTTTQETTLPGISPYKNQAAPVKITNVQLQGAPTERHNWGQTVQYTTVEDAMGYQQDNIRAPNRRQRNYVHSDTNISPSNGGTRAGQTNPTQAGHQRGQYQLQHQVPYVPHQGHYQRGSNHDEAHQTRYNNSGGKGRPH
ncbi:leucine-rich repeat-containing protein 9-like [Asterias rubens]|uniref:leucine-rich repeat-containing protein 9-like n=1 Tax=Asterias rubens TaxID=7604 RepID=UPI0014558B93|nr:leucine-rich repeat-containing protein 9-like [Asterias rubens]XP_033624646.1 leucine-rich repeat-containing protein 9-like [Asterias rubens]